MSRPSYSRPRLLDLFCGAGGAAAGYHRAGFDVVGVDHRPQPRYPFPFVQADVLEFLDREGLVGENFAAVHASPPCQRYTRAQSARKRAHLHPDLVAPVRERLEALALPYVIENVQGAPLRDAVRLCGTSFGLEADGFEHRRHRYFECSFPTMAPPCYHRLPAAPLFGHNAGAEFMRRHGRGFSVAAKRAAMGVDWMNRDELAEAIPPAFTEHIGGFLMAELRAAAALAVLR